MYKIDSIEESLQRKKNDKEQWRDLNILESDKAQGFEKEMNEGERHTKKECYLVTSDESINASIY